MVEDRQCVLSPAGLVHEARVTQRTASAVVLVIWLGIVVAVVVPVLWGPEGLSSRARWVWLPAGALGAQAAIVALRHGAVSRHSTPAQDRVRRSHRALGAAGDFVVACSGGGVKSAWFCLGASQRLQTAGLLARASELVAVSGGGYAAAAYATTQHRRRGEGLDGALSPGGGEMDQLRARTDYLLGSVRARGNLFAALILGLVLNVMGLGAVVILGAQVIAEVLVLSGALTATASAAWSFRPPGWWWVVPLALVVTAATVFARTNGIEPTRRQHSLTRRWVQLGRRGYLTAWAIASLPQVLAWSAMLLLVGIGATGMLLPHIHMAFASRDSWATWVGTVGFSGAGLVYAAASATAKGAQGLNAAQTHVLGPPAGPARWLATLRGLVRRDVAPVVGMLLLSALVYAALVVAVWHAAEGLIMGRGVDTPIGVAALAVLGALKAFGPGHRTSLVPFYRDRLSFAYLELRPRGEDLTLPAVVATRDHAAPPTVPMLTDICSSPRLHLVAAANLRDAHLLPARRQCTPFVFSGDGVGLSDEKLPGGSCTPTATAYSMKLSIADAVAASAAAISPLAGRDSVHVGRARLLLAFANVRLGMWLPNPYWVAAGAFTQRSRLLQALNLWDRTSHLSVVSEAVGVPSIFHPWLYITDGGHYDNLGLVEALRKGPSVVLLLDGTGDDEDDFTAMGAACATARMDLGVEVDFTPGGLTRGTKAAADSAHRVFSATYPDGSSCTIILVKCVWTAGQSWDVEAYRRRNPDFPVLSDELETYGEFDAEAFRQLGWTHLGRASGEINGLLSAGNGIESGPVSEN